MSMSEVVAQALQLSWQERKELAKLLVDSLGALEPSHEKHSILELAGLGAEAWEGIDPQEYVDQLRGEWDHRP